MAGSPDSRGPKRRATRSLYVPMVPAEARCNAMANSARSDPPTDWRSAVTIGIVASLLPLTTILVALRLYTRRYVNHSIGIDDWATLAALVRPSRPPAGSH